MVTRHKLRVGLEPFAHIVDGGVVAAERAVAGGARGDLHGLEGPGGLVAEDLGELGGVELRGGGREAIGEALEIVVRHKKQAESAERGRNESDELNVESGKQQGNEPAGRIGFVQTDQRLKTRHQRALRRRCRAFIRRDILQPPHSR